MYVDLVFGSVFQLEEEELRGVALLVFANKQDLPRAMSVSDITEALCLPGITQQVSVSMLKTLWVKPGGLPVRVPSEEYRVSYPVNWCCVLQHVVAANKTTVSFQEPS